MSNLYTQDGGISMAPVMGGMMAVIMIAVVAGMVGAEPTRTTLNGVVSDPKEQKFVEGALVTLDTLTTYTDAVGYYLFTDLSPGDYSLTVSKDGYETKTLTVTVAEGGNGLDIALAPEVDPGKATLTGFVSASVDIGAYLIEGALVTLDSAEATTDALGAFLFENLDPGTYTLAVTMEGFIDYSEEIKLVAGDNSVSVVLQSEVHKVSLTGTVADAYTGYPLEGASATLDGLATETDGQGRFAFVVSPGEYLLTITMEGYEDSTGYISLQEDTAIQVPMSPPGAQFEVSGLEITPSEPYVGETVEISAAVTNVGDIAGTYVVNCDIVPETYTPLEVVPAITTEISGVIELVAVVMVMAMMMRMVVR